MNAFYRSIGKRVLDVALSGLGIIVFAPIMVVIALLIKLESPGPVLFRQKRIGIRKSTFQILKFRTMRIDAPKDTPTHQLQNPDRYLTRVGRVLRKTSLDELPQLFTFWQVIWRWWGRARRCGTRMTSSWSATSTAPTMFGPA